MTKCNFRISILLVLQSGIFISLQAQTKINSCLFVGEKNRYVLTEKLSAGNGKYETINTLFIWQKDKVLRIVFYYDRKLAVLPKPITGKLKSFESFFPTFKKYVWHKNPQKKSRYYTISIIDETFTDTREDDADGRDYVEKFKAAINIRNKKYNPLADRFGSITVYDGDPEVMIYNEKRKGKPINNLPILFNSEKGDSSSIINPIYIDIYRLDNSEKNNGSILNFLTAYKLYSTVSFLKQIVKYPSEESVDQNYGPGERIIRENTLSYVYKFNSPIDTSSLVNEISKQPLSDRKVYRGVVVMPLKLYFSKKSDSIKYRERELLDSTKKREAAKQVFLKYGASHFPDCSECYYEEISKKQRISKRCPFKIALYKGQNYENWSYSFSKNYRHYFTVEKPVRYYDESWEVQQNNGELRWLLMSPGVGYWMSDMAHASIKYTPLFLNEERISESH